jgi:DNA adenine methylase
MKKIFKWPGGKSRELKRIETLLPANFDRIIEPFAGSAAVSFKFEKPCVLNDLDRDVVNLYTTLQSKPMFDAFRKKIEFAKTLPYIPTGGIGYGITHSLETEYYNQRDILNSRDFSDPVKMAYAFYIVRQLGFSGMLRHKKRLPCGDARQNIAYGWYKRFADNPQIEQHQFLQKCVITKEDYSITIQNNDKAGNFIFVDPPYRNRLGYPAEDWDDTHHRQLAKVLKGVRNAKWLLVHCEDDLYREMYNNFSITEKAFAYSIRFNTKKVGHMYIKNY